MCPDCHRAGHRADRGQIRSIENPLEISVALAGLAIIDNVVSAHVHVLAPIVLLEGSQVMHEELVVVNLMYKHTIGEEYLIILPVSRNVTVAATRS